MASQLCDCYTDGTLEAYMTDAGSDETCYECWNKLGRNEAVELEVYENPWGDPVKIKVHAQPCRERLEDTSWGDFRFFTCEACERMVIRQCPQNGWHSYVRTSAEGEEICLKCYETALFKDGTPRAQFEKGHLDGMFFNRGDAEKHAFEKVDGFTWQHIQSKAQGERVCKKALELIDAGNTVIVEWESMAIGGLEGYVTLWARNNAALEAAGESEIQGRREMDAQDIEQEGRKLC
jgi:hypothetical protein